MKPYLISVAATLALSCNQEKQGKTGKELVNTYCVSCHNYSEAHSEYRPSIFGMNEMGAGFKQVYEKILHDTIHVHQFKGLTRRDKKEIYNFIMTQSRVVEDPVVNKEGE